MLRKRVITLLTFNDGVLFRTKNFQPDYRYTSNFIDAWAVDELILLDITRDAKDIEKFCSVVSNFNEKCFVPMCVGGGVKSFDNISRYLQAGADKVSINTSAIESPKFITKAANKFGSQCIVVSIDVKKVENDYYVFKNFGSVKTKFSPVEFAKIAEDMGAGEILLNSIDRDGSLEGYDNTLNSLVVNSVSIPVIICGGAGKWQDFAEGLTLAGADGVATSNIYHFTEASIKSAKKYLHNLGINIRS